MYREYAEVRGVLAAQRSFACDKHKRATYTDPPNGIAVFSPTRTLATTNLSIV